MFFRNNNLIINEHYRKIKVKYERILFYVKIVRIMFDI